MQLDLQTGILPAIMISILIPFYNEQTTILDTLLFAKSLKSIEKIILVNDGSTDKSKSQVEKELNEKIVLVDIKKNSGKTNALREGLKKVKTKYVLTLDADLTNLNLKEFEQGINLIPENFDLLIWKLPRTNIFNNFFWLTRFDINLSGQRLLKRELLEQALDLEISNYQIEVFINRLAIENNLKIIVLRGSFKNPKRERKWGIKKALQTNWDMASSLWQNPGPFRIIRDGIILGALIDKYPQNSPASN